MKPIYLDYQSTTPTNKDVLEKMIPYFSEVYGNPHSSNHKYGLTAYEAIENGRKKVAKAIGSQPEEIIFTSGATESNNLAIKGSFLYRLKKHNRKKIIIAATEHKCVLESANSLTTLGAKLSIINVNDLYSFDGDIYAPCALGATVNDLTVNKFQYSIIDF